MSLLLLPPSLSLSAPAPSSDLPWPYNEIRSLIRRFGCQHAYLDVGSNIGVQIRKLYEPALYTGYDPKMRGLAKRFGVDSEPTAAERAAGIVKGVEWWNTTSRVLPIFEEYFGPAPRCRVCAIGVEPNPRHEARHKQVQEALQAAGVGALWLSRTAAHTVDGELSINLGWAGGKEVNDVGLSIYAKGRPKDQVTVRSIDLAKLISFVRSELHRGHKSSLPRGDAKHGHPSHLGRALSAPTPASPHARIVMKVDVEGAEYNIMPHLMASPAKCAVDLMFLEWHPSPVPSKKEIAVRRTTEQALKSCPKTLISDIDDETFLYDGKPLPQQGAILCPRGPESLS